MIQRQFKTYDHSPEFKAEQLAWRAHHTKASAPILHELGMCIKNGPHTDHQIAKATGLSAQTIRKLRKFEHGGQPWHSTILLLEQFFNIRK